MQTALKLGWLALLVLTSLFLFFTLTVFTSLLMSPWDSAIDIPEIGTWQRTLNDFFQYSVGQLLLSVPVLLISIALAYNAYRSKPHFLPRIILGNFLLAAGVWVVVMVASSVNNGVLFPHPPVLYDPNYRGFHRSIFPMAALLTTCGVWYIWQRKQMRQLGQTPVNP